MSWIKKGLIYRSEGKYGWDKTHSQVPTAIVLNDKERLRIFYSSRNDKNISQISFIDVSIVNPQEILYVHPEPILLPGDLGTFDDSGVMPSWAVYNNGKLYLYYIGWNVRNTVPYYNSVGLAISNDGKNFERFSKGPLWDRDYKEPFFSASTCVLRHNNVWKNWYLSCTEYRNVNEIVEPRYHIKYAESHNGIDWIRNGVVAIDYKSNEEAGIVKASVIVEKGFFKMWFSYRNFNNYRTDKNNSYKIGYAESENGIVWIRNDSKAGIELSEQGWDSEMMAYPHVIHYGDTRYLFYNGNEFGKTGFGFCVSDK